MKKTGQGHYSIFFSLVFLLRHIRLLAWSLLLVLLMVFLTWISYLEAVHLIDVLMGSFFHHPPELPGVVGWLATKTWIILDYIFLFFTRVISFYLAFLAAYCLTTPGYVFLSGAVERVFRPELQRSERFSFKTAFLDLWEGIKIGLIGLLVTVAALIGNFVPVIGQALVFFLYVYYSALMFVDYPASTRHWSLGKKVAWVTTHYRRAFFLGLLPALISIVPLINIFLMALFFPLLTVHVTLNFLAMEERKEFLVTTPY